MSTKIPDFQKEQYQHALAKNLPLLRAKLDLSQEEVADMVGTSRQTISLIERGTREMMWDTCMSLTFLFVSNSETRSLMPPLGIDVNMIMNYLNVSDQKSEEPAEGGDGQP